jgi:DnaJ-class molecular chaperone
MAEYTQCKNCKGTGRVPKVYGNKRWETCPICKGTGKKIVKDKK